MDELTEWNDAVQAKHQALQVTIGQHQPVTYRQLSLELWAQVLTAGIEENPALLGPEGSSGDNEPDH